ncbi:hypothetical protein [Bauldia litoralis]|uniref:hypothetical protein n=1 Tax=Bauldia litoralis TaxID=665467 RepID=UPI0032667852
MTYLRALVAAVALLCVAPAHANLSGPCPPIEVTKGILAKAGQTIIGYGLAPADQGDTVVFLATDNAGNWTMLFSGKDGTLCLAAGGTGWTPVVPGKDA